ncbi:ThiF family adenylyltransferase [Bacillus atrophaeus]|uniref:ThiF family adenylyltransferase n=1 Tax=Bacillus atrophaeus TaxID=1452 RepID=UPI00227DBCD0|nr:ThiF family adenylyltransferase [Bacillus atrophaeus]MCY8836529.1 ThiF family adenylyltransferase [Bacillus atrophaeus]MEC5221334.1 ThiF family adenylyltransferase [Bacillus atrophaeus]MED4578875.1 ThiF family adenylyltransferase [Bacillus atrophaeus]MED4719738.1 ThiF family adenylyltransferase [Bacillus atrophaeus]
MLNDSKRMTFKDGVLVLTYSTHIIIQYQKAIKLEPSDNVLKVIDKLKTGCYEKEICEVLGEADGIRLVSVLQGMGALIEVWENQYKDHIVEKQLYYLEQFGQNPNDIQKKLDHSTVVILGLGGVGSIILQHLVSAGVQRFILIDYDDVSIHNLNRQFVYNRSSVRKPKVAECQQYISGINSKAEVSVFHKEIKAMPDLDFLNPYGIDIFVNAADKPIEISEWVYGYCKKRNIAFITGGVGISSGQWGPLLTPESYRAGISYEKHKHKDLISIFPSEPIKGSLGATNSIISSFMSHDIISYLAGNAPKSINTNISLHFDELKITETKLNTKESIS